MKRLIFDHLRRWGWLWAIIGIANGFSIGAFLDEPNKIQGVTIQLILWIGALQLSMDLQKGISRVQASLPLTTRQIGQAWWIFSVGLPALLLAITAGIGLLIHSIHADKAFPFNAYAVNFASNTTFIGTMFLVVIGELPIWPQNLYGWLRRIFSFGILISIFVVKTSFDTPAGILVLLAALTMTVIGWLRAEQMVVLRATFRPGIQIGKQQEGQHRVASGFGGLSYLWQTMAVRIGYMIIAGATYLIIMRLVMPGFGKMTFNHFLSATAPALCSFGFFGLFILWIMPVLMQLRHLRTLPISTTAIAALLTLAPCALICLVGLGWSACNGTGIQVPVGFIGYAAAFCLGAPLIVWQGLRQGMYALIMMIMMVTVIGGAILFKGNPTSSFIVGLVSLTTIGVAFEITRRLLKSSSKAYRPLPTNMNQWGAWR